MEGRELIFKNLTSPDKKRKDIYISDTVERNGIRTVTKRHFVYIIGERSIIKSLSEISEIKAKAEIEENKRHVFIFKTRDTKLKRDSFICDIVGKFYTAINDTVYLVAFKHSFEVDFSLVTA